MMNFKNCLLYGFALFAMFFGSGNLVFPLEIGVATQTHWFVGCLGLLLTGVLLPFLGLFVIKLYHGSYEEFFGQAGRCAQVVLPLFTLSLMSSFGVFPRCITVAYGGIQQFTTLFSLPIFSFFFCLLCYVVCLKDRVVIQVLGKWMSPLLLVALVWMTIQGAWHAPEVAISEKGMLQAFGDGFLIGYQTMDLFAAFFFSSFIFLQLQKSMAKGSTTRELFFAALPPSIFGMILLAAVYMGLVFLGAHYAQLLHSVQPELMLPVIASYALGKVGAFVIAVAILFSCFTTAVALDTIYARYLCSVIPGMQDKFPVMLLGTTVVAYAVSLLDFKGIAAFIAPLLELSYPSIIALTVMSIVTKRHKVFKAVICYVILVFMLYMRYAY